MVTIKVFDSVGVKELNCFETLDSVPYCEDFLESVEDPEDED